VGKRPFWPWIIWRTEGIPKFEKMRRVVFAAQTHHHARTHRRQRLRRRRLPAGQRGENERRSDCHLFPYLPVHEEE